MLYGLIWPKMNGFSPCVEKSYANWIAEVDKFTRAYIHSKPYLKQQRWNNNKNSNNNKNI